jgi:hypothetical protein
MAEEPLKEAKEALNRHYVNYLKTDLKNRVGLYNYHGMWNGSMHKDEGSIEIIIDKYRGISEGPTQKQISEIVLEVVVKNLSEKDCTQCKELAVKLAEKYQPKE